MKILRSAFLVLVAIGLMLGTGLFLGGRAAAASSPDPDIWCGLWTGANLYIPPDERLAAYNCRQARTASQTPPNQNSPGAYPQQGTNTTGNHQTYAALGDSVAAGLGLPGTPEGSRQDIRCGRSNQSYPYIVAESLGLSLAHRACTGATLGALVTQQHISGPNPNAQLDAAFAQGTPELITITAGANDARWASLIRACYARTCNTESRTRAANASLVVLQTKLYYALNSIQSRSGGQPPRVIVTGYYNPLSASCENTQQKITADELAWLADATNALNQTLRSVTEQFPFAKFVPINFTGHDICSDDPWVQGLDSKAPFHPTAAGQQAIAASVLQAAGR